MPDWKSLVRDRMPTLKLPAGAKEEVISELAAHLEEIYENALDLTQNEADALRLALQEVKDWRTLAARIHRAQSTGGPMNHRTKSFWIPALASITAASLSMTLLQFAGVRPALIWTKPVAMSFYWPWLGILPFCGALAAWLSRLAGGSTRARILASLGPVLWVLLGFITEPIELAIHGPGHLVYFAYGVTNWIVIPGSCLLLGAAPFLPGRADEIETAKAKV